LITNPASQITLTSYVITRLPRVSGQ
jgi:hypothetical protein